MPGELPPARDESLPGILREFRRRIEALERLALLTLPIPQVEIDLVMDHGQARVDAYEAVKHNAGGSTFLKVEHEEV